MNVEFFTDRTTWLGWRRDRLGSSDIAGVLGVSRWSSPRSVWADKLGLLDDGDRVESDKMRYGRYAEHMFSQWFADETGLSLDSHQACVTHENGWAAASVDAFVFEGAPNGRKRVDWVTALGVCEMKTEGIGRMWADDGVPDDYWAQIQWQLHVTGAERGWFAVLHGWRFELLEVARDEPYIAQIALTAETFWQDHVIGGVPPATIGHPADFDALTAQYPTHDEGVEAVLDPTIWNLYRLALAQAKDVDANVARHRAALAAQLGDAEYGTVDGVRVCTFRTSDVRRIPTGRLPRWVRYRFGETQQVRTLRVSAADKKGKK